MAGAYGRNDGSANIQTISVAVDYTQGQSAAVTIGRLPKGAVVDDAGVTVTTAFNDGTNKLCNIGTSSDASGFASAISLATIGRIGADDMATSNDLYDNTQEVTCIFTHARTGTAATAGAGIAWVKFFVPAN